jgi:hypothetical protein
MHQLEPTVGETRKMTTLRDILLSFRGSKGATRLLALAASALFSSGLISCGAGNSATSTATSSAPPAGSILVSLSPLLAAVTTSQSQPFTATISGGSTTLTWFVDGIKGGNSTVGMIVSTDPATALYSPSSSTTPGDHNITAQTSTGTMSQASVVAVTDLAGVITHHNDNARTGQNLKEYALTPASVSSATFGKLFSCPLDLPGQVYAEPLYVANVAMNDSKIHNVVFVATESDWVYAFDADLSSCQQLWKKSMLAAGETTVPAADTQDLDDLVPEYGITSTPVIDINSLTIYVCAKSKDSSGQYHHRLHALDLTSGAEPVNPVEVTANNFVPLYQHQRPALLLDNGTVYVAVGSNGDTGPYQGWLMAYDAATLVQKFVWFSTDPTQDNQGAIWQAGDGVAADSSGNIYVETANGLFDADTGGINYSDSVVKLSGSGSILDYFTPFDQSTFDMNDVDLGSAGAVILPDSLGSAAHPHLLLATGKPGILYLLDQVNLGKFNSGFNADVQEVSVEPNLRLVVGGMFGQPAYWNGNLYIAAVADFLRQYTITNGAISAVAQSQSTNTFNLRGTRPAVSANGTTGGIVWALDISGYPDGPAVLYAYDATNLSHQLYSSPSSGNGSAGKAVKFTVPTVANGKVYVGTQGQLDVFGLLPN